MLRFLLFAIPRLSAAMTTPSLNFAASTEVPVTIGLWVCWFGPAVWKCEGSYAPYTSSLGYDALVWLLFEAGEDIHGPTLAEGGSSCGGDRSFGIDGVGGSKYADVVRIEVLKSKVVVVMLVGSRWLRSSPAKHLAWSKLPLYHQFETVSNKHCTSKMLGIDYPDSDEEDVVSATKPEVRLAKVH